MRIRSSFGMGLTLGLALAGMLVMVGAASAVDDEGAQDKATLSDAASSATESGKADAQAPAPAKDKDAALRAALSRSQEGLFEVHLADGTVAIDLQGRFQVMSVVRMLPDGTISFECSTHLDSSGEYREATTTKQQQPAPLLVAE